MDYKNIICTDIFTIIITYADLETLKNISLLNQEYYEMIRNYTPNIDVKVSDEIAMKDSIIKLFMDKRKDMIYRGGITKWRYFINTSETITNKNKHIFRGNIYNLDITNYITIRITRNHQEVTNLLKCINRYLELKKKTKNMSIEMKMEQISDFFKDEIYKHHNNILEFDKVIYAKNIKYKKRIYRKEEIIQIIKKIEKEIERTKI